jgi:hypothetical protein
MRHYRGFVLVDESDRRHVDTVFASKESAADMAVRYAQDNAALYEIFY